MPDLPVFFDEDSANEIAPVVRAFRPPVLNRAGKPIPRNPMDRWALVLIGTPRTCGGVYAGAVVLQNATEFNTAETSFDDTAIGAADTDEVTVINLAERGETTHALTDLKMKWARLAEFRDDAGRECYLIDSVELDAC